MSLRGSSGVRRGMAKMTVAFVLAAVPAVGLSIPVYAAPSEPQPAAPPSSNTPQPPAPPPPAHQQAPAYDWNYGADGGGGGGGGG
jgi:hypothetical protein